MDSKFKVGDVLKFEDGLRGIVASVYPQATNSNEYLYDLWTCYKGAIDWDSWSESELVDKVKVLDHIDISSVVGGKESNEPDYKMILTAYYVAEASNLRHMLAAKESENMDLKNENAFLRHKLREAEAQRDKVKNERDIFEEENGKLMQKIACAEKQLDECAKRIYEALGHLSTVVYNK